MKKCAENIALLLSLPIFAWVAICLFCLTPFFHDRSEERHKSASTRRLKSGRFSAWEEAILRAKVAKWRLTGRQP